MKSKDNISKLSKGKPVYDFPILDARERDLIARQDKARQAKGYTIKSNNLNELIKSCLKSLKE